MVRATTRTLQELHDHLKKNGAEYDDHGNVIWGSWRRGAIESAAKKFDVHRNTIYNWLKKHPRHPQRELRKGVIPKYVERFEDSETVQLFLDDKKGKRKLSEYMRVGLQAWKILNEKDPLSWTEEDYRLIWEHPEFRDPMMGTISFNNAVAVRQWFPYSKLSHLKDEPYFTTKGLKRPKGMKKTHWLKSQQEIEDVINYLQYPDTLWMFFLGIQCGGRFSSMRLIKPVDITYVNGTIMMWEPKVKQYVERDFLKEVLTTLKKYLFDFNFEGKNRIFPRSLNNINSDLTQAGRRAKIPFSLTTHTALKHTFVSLASNHGVSLEVVSRQTGTDPNTLMDFYAGLDRRKIRHELCGEEYQRPDFDQLIRNLIPIVKDKYEAIKTTMKPQEQKKARKLERAKKRKINWKTIEKMVDNENTPEPLKAYWSEALKLHKEGMKYSEIKKRLKKGA